MTDTPRVDVAVIPGAVAQVGDPTAGGYYVEAFETVPASLARQLERELAEAQAQIKRAADASVEVIDMAYCAINDRCIDDEADAAEAHIKALTDALAGVSGKP